MHNTTNNITGRNLSTIDFAIFTIFLNVIIREILYNHPKMFNYVFIPVILKIIIIKIRTNHNLKFLLCKPSFKF